MWQNVWHVINANAYGIQVFFVAGALMYAGIQAGQIRKQLRLGTITAWSLHYKQINQMVLEYDSIAELFGAKTPEERGDFAAAIMIGMFETRFLLHKAGALDRKMWNVDQLTMIRTFGEYTFMLPGWRKYESEYYPPFQRFVNAQILPRVKPRAPA